MLIPILVFSAILGALPALGQEYCPEPPPVEKNAPKVRKRLEGAAKEQSRLVARLQKNRFLFDQRATRDAIYADIKLIREDIQRFIKANEVPEDRALVRQVIVAYLAIVRDLIAEELQAQPEKLESLMDYRDEYGITLTVDDIATLYLKRDDIPAGVTFYPSPSLNGKPAQVMTFDDSEILKLQIRGLGNSRRFAKPEENTRRNYFDTSRCLLAATEVDKMAIYATLRGETVIDFKELGGKPVCGKITLADIGRASLEKHTRPDYNNYHRIALQKALPSFEANLDEGFLLVMGKNNLREDDKFIAVYLNHYRGENQPSDGIKAMIKDDVEKAYNKIDRNFDIGSLPQFWGTPYTRDQISILKGNCDLKVVVEDEDEFNRGLMLGERIHFFNQLALQLISMPFEFVDVSNAFIDSVILQVIYKAKVAAAASALRDSLAVYEDPKTSGNIDTAVEQLRDKFIIPVLRAEILDKPKDYDKLVRKIRQLYQTDLKLTHVFDGKRQKFMAAFKHHADLLVKYDNPNVDLKELPFYSSLIWSIYHNKVNELSPTAKEMAKIIFQEPDPAIANFLWRQVNEWFDSDLDALKLGDKVFYKEDFGDKTVAFLGKFFNQNDDYKARQNEAKINKHDFETLLYLAMRLGIVTRLTPPESLSDLRRPMGLDQDTEAGREAKKNYREGLRNKIFTEYRMLEMPYNGEPYYKAVAAQDDRVPFDALFNSGIVQIEKNVESHYRKIVSATKIGDLKDYVTHSLVLNTLLGEDDLDAMTMRKDFWQSIRADAAFQGTEEFVFPLLLQEHYQTKALFLKEANFKREMWDEFFTTINIATMPLMMAWGMKTFMPFLPRIFGGKAIPQTLEYISDKTIGIIDGYWFAMFGYLAVDALVASPIIYFAEHQDVKKQEELAYTEVWNYGVPLIDHATFIAQKNYHEQQKTDRVWRALQNAFFFSLPLIAPKAINYYVKWIHKPRMARKQAIYDGHVIREEHSQILNIKKAHEAKFTARLERMSRRKGMYFKHLKVPAGTWRATELQAALEKIRSTGTAKEIALAENAYRRLLQTLAEEFVPIQNTKVLNEAFVSSAWGSVDEGNAFVKAYEDMIGIKD